MPSASDGAYSNKNHQNTSCRYIRWHCYCLGKSQTRGKNHGSSSDATLSWCARSTSYIRGDLPFDLFCVPSIRVVANVFTTEDYMRLETSRALSGCDTVHTTHISTIEWTITRDIIIVVNTLILHIFLKNSRREQHYVVGTRLAPMFHWDIILLHHASIFIYAIFFTFAFIKIMDNSQTS